MGAFAASMALLSCTQLENSAASASETNPRDGSSSSSSGRILNTAPIVPLNTNFWSYWHHYWTTWLPDHPVYEMIELTVYESPEDPEDILVRVFLTEREGQKRQYFYLNDEEEVGRTRANAYYRDIHYRRTGVPGGPQNLHVKFEDKDGVPIEWTITFDDGATLRNHDNGLTPSIHSVGSLLLFALRTKTADTRNDEILFAGENYAHNGVPQEEVPSRSWYNQDYYSAVVLFGSRRFDYEDGALTNNRGRRFEPVDGNPRIFRTQLLGPENYVEIHLDEHGGTHQLSHYSRGHSLDFKIEPALPPSRDMMEGQTYRFTAGFEGGRDMMTGDLKTYRTENLVILEWTPTAPEWALEREFWTAIQLDDGGYSMRVTDDRSVIYGPDD